MSGIAVRKTAVLTEPAPSQDMPMTETATETPIVLTESAARRISEIAAAEASNKLLRVSVEGGGCSGFQYKFDLVADSEPDDLLIERNGAKVLIDPVSVEYMAGSEIDFVDDLIGASFKINNPNATAGCGCGTSFSI
jgi:iron-sulfur cluster assembly accessory protein